MRARRTVLLLASATLILPLCACLAPADSDHGACSGVLDGEEVSLDLRPGDSRYRIDELTTDPVLDLHYSDGDHELTVEEARLEGPAYVLPVNEPVALDDALAGGSSDWVLSWMETVLSPSSGELELREATETLLRGRFEYDLPGDDALTCTFSLSRGQPRDDDGGGGSARTSSSDWDWD
ncbi:MAG TPA: hypothetical protein RMH99_25020 [Sandaracinaceae bacterium LLY-WYZ-13_1]|nr:hypothetical protein [Sandaracinaceae bacterium LLY-WYZ-13_1]